VRRPLEHLTADMHPVKLKVIDPWRHSYEHSHPTSCQSDSPSNDADKLIDDTNLDSEMAFHHHTLVTVEIQHQHPSSWNQRLVWLVYDLVQSCTRFVAGQSNQTDRTNTRVNPGITSEQSETNSWRGLEPEGEWNSQSSNKESLTNKGVAGAREVSYQQVQCLFSTTVKTWFRSLCFMQPHEQLLQG
jgi:hypothetical protein